MSQVRTYHDQTGIIKEIINKKFMKKLFAVPTNNGKLCAHFGHCEQFAVIETEDQKILNIENFLVQFRSYYLTIVTIITI